MRETLKINKKKALVGNTLSGSEIALQVHANRSHLSSLQVLVFRGVNFFNKTLCCCKRVLPPHPRRKQCMIKNFGFVCQLRSFIFLKN